MRLIISYLIGLIFGTGIIISGMGNPAKVVNFFDIAGTWDPSLMFVMGGALAVTALGYHFILKRPHPMLSKQFYLPTRADIDTRLISGSALFGVGWGIAGFCPGGALPVVGVGGTGVLIFVAAMIGGILLTDWFSNRPQRQEAIDGLSP